MTEDRLPLAEMAKAADGDFLRSVAEAVTQLLVETDVDGLVQAMGLSGVSKSMVSKLCRDIDERVNAFLDHPLAGDWACLWLDATSLKQREGGRIATVAATIAVAANTQGKREIVGLRIGPSEAETSRATFLKSLVRRGLRGTKLVTSDAHEGLKAAIRRAMGCARQRCRARWMSNAQAFVPKGHVHRRQRGRRAGAHGLSRPAPGQDPLDQPDRAAEQGGQAPRL